MGNLLTRLLESIPWGHRDMRILMVGLDGAGKTTLLYKLKLGDTVSTVPTIGFNVETLQYRNVSFTVWDIGGQDKLRKLWRFYFENSEGLIFVVDSNDKERILEARDELHSLMNDPELQNVKLLVLANKCDLPNAMSTSQIAEKLVLSSFRNRVWFLQSCCAVSGEGLYEGLDWLASTLRNKSGS